jgi:integrase
VPEATLPGLADGLAASRHAGGYRFKVPERVLRQFAGHCRREGYPDGSITREAVDGFLYGRHLRASTVRRNELALRQLAGHAQAAGWDAFTPAAATQVRVRRQPPYVLTDSKNGESRTVPVTSRLTATLEGYIAAAHPAPETSDHVFYSVAPGRPVSQSTAYLRFRGYLADAGIPHFAGGPHPHSLRHGLAVANLRRWAGQGADLAVTLPYLACYMGHADLRGTRYYLRLTADAYPEVMAQAQLRFGYVIPETPGDQP